MRKNKSETYFLQTTKYFKHEIFDINVNTFTRERVFVLAIFSRKKNITLVFQYFYVIFTDITSVYCKNVLFRNNDSLDVPKCF